MASSFPLMIHVKSWFLYYFFAFSSFAAVLWPYSSNLLNMGLFSQFPSQATLFSAYASISASTMMIRSIANEIIPYELQTKLRSYFQYLFKPISTTRPLILIIKKYHDLSRNEVFDASETYLCTKITPSVDRIEVFKGPRDRNVAVAVHEGEDVTDEFEGIQLKWKLVYPDSKNKSYDSDDDKPAFHLELPKKHYAKVLDSYLPHVLSTVRAKEEEEKMIHLHRLNTGDPPVIFEHPASFDTLAMEEKLKKEILEDLERFIRRKEFYKRVGKAWKRGYLLYGPPGTGKSTLIAAIANHLKFDVYDLELSKVRRGEDLRRCLRAIKNQSILVFEDIDCTLTLQDRKDSKDGVQNPHFQLSLSDVLNTLDGLWSSCADERIIIFTTNHKDSLDPALLRPGRMDMHIHMSYCTADGFSTLALTYLQIPHTDQSRLYLETKDWISKCQITAAQVAEMLMKGEDADIALRGLLEFMKKREMKEENDLESKRSPTSDREVEKIECAE